MKVLSIIIVNWNARQYLHDCLASIYTNRIDYEFEVWVVDNASSDQSVQNLPSTFPDVRLIANSENLGFAAANNQAIRKADSKYLLFQNPDTSVSPDAINQLVAYLESHPQVAAVGPRLNNPDGSLQISASRAPTLWRELWRLFHLDKILAISQYPDASFKVDTPIKVDVLLGACFLIRSEIIAKIGLFDENYFVYSEEVDLFERVRKSGFAVHWVPFAAVTHFGGVSTRQASEKMFIELYRNKVKFFRKHHGNIQADLYKIILWFSALVRISACWLLGRIPNGKRPYWESISNHYQRLIQELAGI